MISLTTPCPTAAPPRLTVAMASPADREAIYALRHDVYAEELGQHPPNAAGRLTDPLDAFNHVIVARAGGHVIGFVSVTPPGSGRFSVDKYVPRDAFPFPFDGAVYEVRLLTVAEEHRGGPAAGILMYAALRWIVRRGGKRIVAIGRREVLDLYLKLGLKPLGITVRGGAVTFEVLHGSTGELLERASEHAQVLRRLEPDIDWQLDVPFRTPRPCYHGGAFFDAIGDEFDALERRDAVVNADVLDAWFDPSPKVLEALTAHLPWLLRTSPPAGCEGMVRAIARARGVDAASVLPGAGSSDLIFLALREWLRPASRALILDPMYGEYAHVLEHVIGCRVERLLLDRREGYVLDPERLAARLQRGYDLAVIVNPNSPTGRHADRAALGSALERTPASTRIWVDETYVEYAGADQSLERIAAASENIVVCKSLSKVYALSGARAAYLCGPPGLIEALRPLQPPWAVSLPAQVAAVAALKDPEHYARRHAETRALRTALARDLRRIPGLEVVPGVASFLLCHLPEGGPTAAEAVERCRGKGVYLRDVSSMGQRLGPRALRIAVKDAAANRRVVETLAGALRPLTRSTPAPPSPPRP
ncbi:MAG: aminotransferase class I/II-fold pyridoxal phosphate-dependent enzyme [Planctomycetes bacterium]|nr:aminotransferase class I/II-fold pyridoxal phosphate-dependent enzyme [Planctomycetota bacterium]